MKRQHHHVHVDHHREVRAPVSLIKIPAHRADAKRTARQVAKAEVLHEKVKDFAATTNDPNVKAAVTALVHQARAVVGKAKWHHEDALKTTSGIQGRPEDAKDGLPSRPKDAKDGLSGGPKDAKDGLPSSPKDAKDAHPSIPKDTKNDFPGSPKDAKDGLPSIPKDAKDRLPSSPNEAKDGLPCSPI